MHEQEMTRQQRLSYEKVLYQYTSALEKGDLDEIIPILNDAENDSLLEQMIMETHEAYLQQEQNIPSQSPQLNRHANTSPRLIKRTSSTHKTYHFAPFQVIAAVFFATVLIGSAIILFNFRTTSSTISQDGKKVASTSNNITVIYTSSSTTDNLIAQRIDTGATIWRYPLGPSSMNSGDAKLLIQDHIVYVVHNKQVQALQASNGKLLWNWKTQEGSELVAVERAIPFQLIVEHDRLYVSGYLGGKLYVLNARNGAMLWQYDSTQGSLAPLLTVHDDVAYVLTRGDDNDNGLKALRGADGTEIWTSQPMAKPRSVTSNDNVLYVQIMTSKFAQLPFTLMALDSRNGQLIWSVAMQGDIQGPLIFTHGSVVLFDGNNFCAYRGSNGTQMWCTKNKPDINISNYNIQSINDIVYGAYSSFVGITNTQSFVVVQAINANNGNILWSRQIKDANTSFTNAGDSLIFFAHNTLQSLSFNDGHTLWQTQYNDHNSSIICIAAGVV